MYRGMQDMGLKLEPPRAIDPPPAPVTPPPRPSLPAIRLMGVRIHAINEARTIEHILDELDAGRGGVVVTPNLDHLRRSQHDVSFAAIVAEANLVVADGMPVVWASRVQGTPLPQRVAGSDLISSLSRAASFRGRSIFLLGGSPGTADAAAQILRSNFSGLKIAGTYCPPMGFDEDPAEHARLMDVLRAAQPDIVFVALGSPKQEFLVDRIGRLLPRTWWLGVGISFSFLSGDVERAPTWMQRTGLEWLHRVWQEPRRLFHRYFVAGVPFATWLMINAAGERLLRSVGLYRGGPPAPDVEPELALDADLAPPPAPVATPDPIIELPAGGEPPLRESNLRRIRGLVLLGGSVRSTELTAAINRSVLDLPLDDGATLLDHWLGHARDLARHLGLERLPVRITLDRSSIAPAGAAPRFAGDWAAERDVNDLRGTGGLLRDLAQHYGPDDYLLVANAAQVLLDPLVALATVLDRRRCDVSLIAHKDGSPAGMMLVRCGALTMINPVGFVDMKEQALPAIASRFDVRAVQTRRPTGLAVRTLADYLAAIRRLQQRRVPSADPDGDPLAEDWQRRFAIVEAGAGVSESAYVHDSVVLKGARVEPGAAVVRSLLCPGTLVRAGEQIVDTLCRSGR
jgi:N-acetylglucosaminyldiphosphoundecaprenol N-acetyl-beta-D-mannosaminyltransferase